MIRNAQLSDVPEIRDLINLHAQNGRMLFRSMASLYESIRDFKVYELDGKVAGCCALPIIWADLAEVKSLSVLGECQGKGIGAALVKEVIKEARHMKLPKIFTLTLEEAFFVKMGFKKVSMDSLPMKVWSECIHCPKQDHCDEIALQYSLED